MEYCCHIWALGLLNSHLPVLIVQNRLCGLIGDDIFHFKVSFPQVQHYHYGKRSDDLRQGGGFQQFSPLQQRLEIICPQSLIIHIFSVFHSLEKCSTQTGICLYRINFRMCDFLNTASQGAIIDYPPYSYNFFFLGPPLLFTLCSLFPFNINSLHSGALKICTEINL